MILPAGLVLLPFVFASLGFWDELVSSGRSLLGWAEREYQRRVIYGGNFPGEGDDEDYEGYEDDGFLPDLPQYRLSTTVMGRSCFTCWPSKGGFYKLNDAGIVQRQFLGIDRRAHEILRPEVSAEVEDAFCNQLRKLGALWWEHEDRYAEYLFLTRPARDDTILYVGWPASGGVWALNTTREDAVNNGYGVIYNSINMEEQCDMIEEFGGTFYQDPKDCPYLDLAENDHDEKILEL
ncbi:hypothetical protein V8C42DRAFT_328164 [Trichoderma barbatum]